MNKIFNYIITCIILTILVFETGCTKMDDRVYSEIVASKYVYGEADLARIVGKAYQQLRFIAYGSFNGLSLNDETADDVTYCVKPWGWNGGEIYLHKHTWTAQQGNFNDCWTKCFSGINGTNKAIEQVEQNVFVLTNDQQKVMLAELKVLRAYYYYILCDYFGSIPIVEKFSVPEGYIPVQNSRSEVYNFIVKEITDAIPFLNEETTKMYGRFNKFGAYALLARIYLNAEVYKGTPEWQKCIDACDAIINTGKYKLTGRQVDNFVLNNENSVENIFVVPYDEKKANGSDLVHKALNGQHQQVYKTYNGGAWGGINMIPQFISTFDPDDERLKVNYVQGPQYNGYTGELMKTSFVIIEPFVITNTLPSVDFTINENNGFRPGKVQYYMGMNANCMGNDLPIFRYAMVLMMKAEAMLRLGNSTNAAQLVTQVRARNFINTPEKAIVTGADLQKGSVYDYGMREIKTVINGQEKVKENITHEGGDDIVFGRMLSELGWEFDQEGVRRQDMIRFKTASGNSVFTSKSWLSHKADNNSKYNLFPIPQEQLQKNANLKQNTGY